MNDAEEFLSMNDHASRVAKIVDFLEKTPLRDSYLLALCANALNGPTVRHIEKEFDVGRDEFNVLFTLAAQGPSLATDICQLNSRPKNSISRAVSRLERRGMITKTTIEEDRRKEVIALTEAGNKMYEQTLPVFVERQRELFAPLDYEDRRLLEAILKKALVNGPDWR